MRKIQFPHHNRGTVPLKRTQSWLLMSVGTSRGRARNLCALPHSSHPWRTKRLSAQQVLVLLLSVRIAVQRSKAMKINVFLQQTASTKHGWWFLDCENGAGAARLAEPSPAAAKATTSKATAGNGTLPTNGHKSRLNGAAATTAAPLAVGLCNGNGVVQNGWSSLLDTPCRQRYPISTIQQQ